MTATLERLAALLDAELVGNGKTVISGVAGLDTARHGDIVFAETPEALKLAAVSPASAVIVGQNDENGIAKPLLRTKNPKYAFSRVVNLFNPPRPYTPGVHPSAVVDETAVLGTGVHIGPNVVIDERVRIGDRSVIQAGSFIGSNTQLGADCTIHPHVTIREQTVIGQRVIIHSGTVIGGDGFGYVCHNGRHEKLLQLGNVVIDDDVEIGCNTCIDRASFGSTKIGQGTKIDNLVQIGHNAELGRNCIVVAQVGISGSVRIGNECILAGQVGVADHAILEDRVTVGAKSGVPSRKRIHAGQTVLGQPARKIDEFKRQWAVLASLPSQISRFQELAQEVHRLRLQMDELRNAEGERK